MVGFALPMPTYLFKCLWRATSITIVVDAPNEPKARKKAESILKRTEGGLHCQEIRLIEVQND